jgi:hypothetical protein
MFKYHPAGLLGVWGEARRFGISTSGHVLPYDPAGGLIFSGGIPQALGRRGGNRGREAVLARILATAAGRTERPVFGCSLATLRIPSQGSP